MRCGVRDTRRGVYGRLSSVSVSEKGAGLSSGPLVEDHYELELPWLLWLRTGGRSRSRKCEGESRRETVSQVSRIWLYNRFYTPPPQPRLLCLCYPPPFLLMALFAVSSQCGLVSRIPVLCRIPLLCVCVVCVPFLFPSLIPFRFAVDYCCTRVPPTLQVRKMCRTIQLDDFDANFNFLIQSL